MSKNSVDVYGAKGKSNVLFFDPEDLTLVTDKAHPLFDERVNLPLDEAMVRNVMHYGVKQAISIFKDPETGQVLVAAGRQRVKHAREANRRLLDRGELPIQVPAIVSRGDMEEHAALMVLENEIRQADTPLGRAQKMQRFLDRGRGLDTITLVFGCTEQTAKRTLALLDAPADVRKAVDAGQITLTAAHKLAKLKPEEQRAKVAEMAKAGEGLDGHSKARAQRAVIEPQQARMRTRKQIEQALAGAKVYEARTALEWVLGGREEMPA